MNRFNSARRRRKAKRSQITDRTGDFSSRRRLIVERLEDRNLLAASIMSMDDFAQVLFKDFGTNNGSFDSGVAQSPATADMIFLADGPHPDELQIWVTDNVAAADTTNANELQPGGASGLNLTGAGYTVGVWDGGRVRGTHNELSGRVIYQEPSAALDDHATHVAATIGASGVNSSARGMASDVTIRSWDFGNDIFEMRNATSLIDISNHSYGGFGGWEVLTSIPTALGGGPIQNPIGTTSGKVDVWYQDKSVDSLEDRDFGKYSDRTSSLDDVIYDNPQFLSVWAAGNDRDNQFRNSSADNTYVTFFSGHPGAGFGWIGAGWYLVDAATFTPPGSDGNGGTGYDSLDVEKVAKNTLVVGAVNDVTIDPYGSNDIAVTSFSSFGPTDDGRIKPDVVGNGKGVYSALSTSDSAYASWDGTSMAAPNVTGSTVLLLEHYENTLTNDPLASTLKSLLIHTATDGGNVGPDYAYGWGLVNVREAADVVTDASTGVARVQELNFVGNEITEDVIPADGQPLKVTIAWTDPAGAPSASNTLDDRTSNLVNDLDLWITGPDGTHYPWTLDVNSPTTSAKRTQANHVDNVEQVLIDSPAFGRHTIHIGATGTVTNQVFSIVITGVVPPDLDDQISEAVPIAFGQSISADFRVSPQSVIDADVDMYKFTTTAANQIVGIDEDSPGDSVPNIIGVFDSTGQQLTYKVQSGVGPGTGENFSDPYVEVLIPTPGTYYFAISQIGNLNYDPITGNGDRTSAFGGNYTVSLHNRGVDADRDFDSASTVAVGATVGSVLDSSLDVDFFRIDVPARTSIEISVGGNSNVVPRLYDGGRALTHDPSHFGLAKTLILSTYFSPLTFYLQIADSRTYPSTQHNNFANVGGNYLLTVRNTNSVIVDTLIDEDDGNYSAGNLSLREAIKLADINPIGGLGPNAVPVTIVFDPSLSGTISLNSPLVIDNPLNRLDIVGPGADRLVIDAGNGASNFRAIEFVNRVGSFGNERSSLTLRDLSITGGTTSGTGGAIYHNSSGSLTLNHVDIYGNQALYGGGIYATGITRLEHSRIEGNTATVGGGVWVANVLTVGQSAILNNTAGNAGGGIYHQRPTTGSSIASGILSSTISGNRVVSPTNYGSGGGIANYAGKLTITNSTISGNLGGGGVWSYANSPVVEAKVESSILFGNVGGDVTQNAIQSKIISLGYNLVGNGTNTVLAAFNGPEDRIGVDPLLAPLGDYGGRARSHALRPGSPAIDAGKPGPYDEHLEATDQRGAPFYRYHNRVDIGAFEVTPTLTVDSPLENVDSNYESGNLTLREAIILANALPGNDQINFDASLFSQSILLVDRLPTITDDVAITGPGANLLTLDAGGGTNHVIGNLDGYGIFYIYDGNSTSNINVQISGVTLTGGDVGTGGAINNTETLTLTAVAIDQNAAKYGGGIANSGTLLVRDSTLSNNQSTVGGGGGALNSSSIATIINSTISGNTSDAIGGAIVNYAPTARPAHLTIRSSTLSNNSASGSGTGLISFGPGTNSVTINGSIVEGTVTGTTPTGNNNRSSGPVTITGSNNLQNLNLLLGPLADNGGPTMTHALLPGSPAIDIYNEPITLYRFEETTGTTLVDALGLRPGTLENGVTLGQAGAPNLGGNAALFDGLNDSVVVPSFYDSSQLNGDQYSIDLWFNSVGNLQQTLFGLTDGTTNNHAIRVDLEANNRIRFINRIPAGAVGGQTLLSQGTYIPGTWNHLAVVRDGSSMRIFLNGVQDANEHFGAAGALPSGLQLTIGRINPVQEFRFFDGQMDEFAIYNKPLSPDQINSHFQDGIEAITLGSPTGTFDQRGAPFLRTVGAGVDIGAYELQTIDFGDAPESFGTLTPNGASHQAIGPRLGNTRDGENNGQPSTNATGDGSDEDGVMFGSIGLNATLAAVNIDLQNAATAKVDAWIDFDRNGQWEASEQILTGRDVTTGIQTLNFTVPASGVVPGNTFARVRVSTAGGLQPTGAASNGEVEDYQVTIFPAVPQVDTVTINGGEATRSKVTSLSVTFDSVVDHASLNTAFTVTNITTGTPVGTVSVSPTNDSGKTTAVLTFSGASTLAPLNNTLGTTLLDGNYRLDIAAGQVKLASNNAATMPVDYVFGGQLKAAPNNDDFYRWYGDNNGDDFTDFNDFANGFLPAFGSENGVGTNYNEGLDHNGDGFVDFTDFASGFLPKFGTERP